MLSICWEKWLVSFLNTAFKFWYIRFSLNSFQIFSTANNIPHLSSKLTHQLGPLLQAVSQSYSPCCPGLRSGLQRLGKHWLPHSLAWLAAILGSSNVFAQGLGLFAGCWPEGTPSSLSYVLYPHRSWSCQNQWKGESVGKTQDAIFCNLIMGENPSVLPCLLIKSKLLEERKYLRLWITEGSTHWGPL